MNKPGKMAKGTYYTSRGGTSKKQKEGDFEVGEKIKKPGQVPYTYEGDPETQVGKYVTQSGKISEQPVVDNRGLFGQIFSPNTAGQINQQLALQKLTQQELMPIILEQERQKGEIAKQLGIEQIKEELKLKEQYQPQPNPYFQTAPGDIPYDQPVDAGLVVTQPYLTQNAPGVRGNLEYMLSQQQDAQNAARLKAQQEQFDQQYSLDQDKLSQQQYLFEQQQALERSKLAALEEERKSPKIMNVGNALVRVGHTGNPDVLGIFQQQYQENAGVTKDEKGNYVPVPGRTVPGRWEAPRKVVGNGYNRTPAQPTVIQPPAITPSVGGQTTEKQEPVSSPVIDDLLKQIRAGSSGDPMTDLQRALEAREVERLRKAGILDKLKQY